MSRTSGCSPWQLQRDRGRAAQWAADGERAVEGGEAALEALTVTDNRTGTRRTIDARALFVFIGMTPCTGWLGGLVDLDDHGFVRTGPGSDGADRSLLETSQPGVFAVGDVRAGSAKRVATAVGEGAMAVRYVHEWMSSVPA